MHQPMLQFQMSDYKMITRPQQLGLIILLGALVLYVIWRTELS